MTYLPLICGPPLNAWYQHRPSNQPHLGHLSFIFFRSSHHAGGSSIVSLFARGCAPIRPGLLQGSLGMSEATDTASSLGRETHNSIAPGGPQGFKRVYTACENCRRKKHKCSLGDPAKPTPPCEACRRASLSCGRLLIGRY